MNNPLSQYKSLIRPILENIKAYKVVDAKGFIKLDAMENPYSLPEQVQREIANELAHEKINRYPDHSCAELKEAIYNADLAPKNLPMIIGNGSDELIWLLHTLIPENSKVISFEPSFSMYELNAKICGHQFIKIPLNHDFSLDFAETINVIKKSSPALMWISYPNNPTGNLFDFTELLTIIETNPGFTVIDEAYLPFVTGVAKPTMVDFIEKYPRLIILRTLSKMGFAGLRLGYLICQNSLINEMDKIRLPYNIDRLSAKVGNIILSRYYTHLVEQTRLIVCEKESQISFFTDNFSKFGLQIFPSKANFLLIRHQSAELLYRFLFNEKILIKEFGKSSTLLSNCLRVTIGSREENLQINQAMHNFFENFKYLT